MNKARRPSCPPQARTARETLHTIGHLSSRGFATSLAVIRLVRLARLAQHDGPPADLDYNELNRAAASPVPR